MTYNAIRLLLFKLDPEQAHNLTLKLIQWAGMFPPTYVLLRSMFEVDDPRLEVEVFGLKFKNRIGLAAGYDKNGVAVKGLSALGFGHIEVGTITRKKQIGNPKPRMHRIVESSALINSMGFPNDGVDALKIVRGNARCHVGVNIGKGKDTPIENAVEDYCALLKQVQGDADYVTINVSSPNTLNLRQLQARALLEDLLKRVAAVRDGLPPPKVPLLVKIAPDLNEAEIDDVLAAISMAGVDGIIATNTTIEREGLPDRYRALSGGLSGAPLKSRSTQIIRYIANRTQGRLPIIGVGGICNVDDAIGKLEAGATLVQVYTGLVYSGPGLIKQINRALITRAA